MVTQLLFLTIKRCYYKFVMYVVNVSKKLYITANPSQQMTALAKKQNVTKMTISNEIRMDLGMKSFSS